MFPSLGPKVIKRCPEGHEMDLSWRACPKCTGSTRAARTRDLTDVTMIAEAGEPAGVLETRMVAPGQSGDFGARVARSQAGESRGATTSQSGLRPPSSPSVSRPPAPRPAAAEPPRPAPMPPPRPASPAPVAATAPPSPAPRPASPAPSSPAPGAVAPGGVAKLNAVAGPATGQEFALAPGRSKMGKAPSAEADTALLTLADPYASKNHLSFLAGAGGVVLVDLGSTNGTLVNGQKVGRAILKDGDEVTLGQTTLRISLARPA